MTAALRTTGIEPVGEMPWATHFCHFYETTDDLLETLLAFFKAGLESNEFCAWVVSEPLTEDEAWQALGRAIPRLDRYVSDHSIEVLNAPEVYFAGGEIDRHRIIGNWNNKLAGALSRGYQGMRVSGDTAWFEQRHWAGLVEYEAEVNRRVGGQRMLLLCTYPLTTSAAMHDITRTHQFAIAKRRGRWEVIETSEHRAPIGSATAEYFCRPRRPPRPSLWMRTFGIVRAVIRSTLAGLAAYARRPEYAGGCSQCGRRFFGSAPLLWCASGHKIHRACVQYAMEREICPICGIYVSESLAGGPDPPA
jgi:MEDS: MEthanogen/methylotroph, DcmR Sensory domain